MADVCTCCGRGWPNRPNCHADDGPIHFSCWDEHHSDPTGPWPPEHVCSSRIEANHIETEVLA